VVPRSSETYKRRSREGVERRAEVGGGGSSEDGGDNTTPLERRASSQVGGPIGEGWRDCLRAMTRRLDAREPGGALGSSANAGGAVECRRSTAWESRVIEKVMHGSGRGRWKRSDGPG